MVNFCCCTMIIMLSETHIFEPQNVGLHTWCAEGEVGLNKFTFFDGHLMAV